MAFIFDPSKGETPESLRRKRAIIDSLSASSRRVPQNVGEGLASIGAALAARSGYRDLERAQAYGQQQAASAFAPVIAALGGGAGSAGTSAANTGGGASYRDAIAGIESGGRYDAVGPTDPSLGRPLGKYQIMEANIAPWSKAALGREISADEFLNNPKMQDAIFDHRFGDYVSRYGPEGAAQAWFAGPGGVGKLDRKDVLGTDVGSYGKRFMSAVGGSAPQEPSPPVQVAQATQAPQAAPQKGISGLGLPQLLQIAQNPWVAQNALYAGIVNSLIENQINMNKPLDPLERAQLEKLIVETDRLRNPRGDPFTLSPGQLRFDAQGNQIAQGGPDTKAPIVQTFYDDKTGQEYKAQWNPQTREWTQVGGPKAPSGTQLSVGPNGEVQFQQGSGLKPLTEGQSKDTTFATRAEGALPIIDRYGDALTGLGGTVAGGVPVIGNYMKSADFQRAEQSGKEFLQAILRKDTGAAITPQETEEYGTVYLPRPGDSPEVLAQKKVSRRRALAALEAGMPPAAMLAKERALIATGDRAPDGATTPQIPQDQTPDTGDAPPASYDGDPELWKFLTPEQRKLWP